MSTLICDIVTPAQKLCALECSMVVVPGVEGEMGFLEDHAPLVSTLADGVVRVLTDDTTVAARYALQGGYVEVTGKKVIVLADRAVSIDGIDVAVVKEQITDVQAKLSNIADEAEKQVLEIDLKWYQLLEHAVQAN